MAFCSSPLCHTLPHAHISLASICLSLSLCQPQDEVGEESVDTLLEVAERCNAWQLRAVCRHFIRNRGLDLPGLTLTLTGP